MGTRTHPPLPPCGVTCTVNSFNVLLPPQSDVEHTVVTTLNWCPALVIVSVVEGVLRLASGHGVLRNRSNRCWATDSASARSPAPEL